VLCSFVLFGFAKESQGWEGIVKKVIDGDTLKISYKNSIKTVELYGIDAPELSQPFGKEAQKFLEKFSLGKTAKVYPKKNSVKNSAEIFVLSGYLVSANKKMVKKGFAWSTAKEYSTLEATAKKKRLGLWAGSNPTPPAEYRQTVHKQQTQKKQQELAKSKAALEEQFVNDFLAGNGHATPENEEQDDEKQDNELQDDEIQDIILSKLRERTERSKKEVTGIKNVDFITMNASLLRQGEDNDGKLKVSLRYKSTKTRRDIYWKNDLVSCGCEVTGFFSNDTSRRIAQEDKDLQSSLEDVYITIPRKYLNKSSLKNLKGGYVECTVTTEQKDFSVSKNF